jgi:hypothetical protein
MSQCLQFPKRSNGKDQLSRKLVKQHSDFLLATWLRNVVRTCETLFYFVEMFNVFMAGTAASYA